MKKQEKVKSGRTYIADQTTCCEKWKLIKRLVLYKIILYSSLQETKNWSGPNLRWKGMLGGCIQLYLAIV